MSGITLDDLPGQLREIAELIGVPATLALVERWGGVAKLYIPGTADPDHELARVLSLPAFRLLVERYGRDYIRVDKAVGAMRRLRDEEIRARYAAGESARTLSLATGLTERQIWNILAAGRESGADRQVALF